MRNSIRTGIIKELDLSRGRCRVQTSGLLTDWLPWITHRAGQARSWWAPSVDEQVLVLAVGGELHTAFVLPGIFQMMPRRHPHRHRHFTSSSRMEPLWNTTPNPVR